MMVWIGASSTAYFGFQVHLIVGVVGVVAILMSEKSVAFLQSDSNTHRKVIIHVPVQIKHLTRTVVKVMEKPVVKEHKHDGEIIHHHRHSGHIEHDHSHDIHGAPLHEHRMDEENLPAAASDTGSHLRQHSAHVNSATESTNGNGRKARPAAHARRLSKHPPYHRMPLPARRHPYLTAAAGAGAATIPNRYRPRPLGRGRDRDSYVRVRVLFRSSED